ncbi:MAG: response regulator [Comamonadaceae bacterium]|nr:MAG: response regulator [Comamonadaceae bacterium]
MVISVKQAGLNTYLVEDNRTIRENLVGTLEELTAMSMVGFAEGEDEACTWFASHPSAWNLAIVDLFLKQGSGLGVLQACASRNAHQKVVVLTNYATPDIRKRCLELGADAVFDKSNEIDGLVDYCLSQAQSAEQPDLVQTGNPPTHL